MPYIERAPYVQFIADDIMNTLKNNGWVNFLRYRVHSSNKYADVRLFRSVGSDQQTRYLGMAHGYDTDVPQFNDNRHIFQESPLGLVGYGDGTKKAFTVQIFPISVLEPLYVYVDGTAQPMNSFTVDKASGRIEFNNAPSSGAIIRASYLLGPEAPDPPTYLVFFTFSAVYLEKLAQEGDPSLKLADGDGTTTTFLCPSVPIKAGTFQVYIDSVKVDPPEYTINLETGDLVFDTAPTLGKEITITYKVIVGGRMNDPLGVGDGTNKNFNLPVFPVSTADFELYVDDVLVAPAQYTLDPTNGIVTFGTALGTGEVVRAEYTSLAGGPPIGNAVTINDFVLKKSFDPQSPESLMGAVYSSLEYLYPSLPTVLSFTSEDNFGRAWQRDSLMHYWGNFNKDRINMILRADASGGSDKAYFVPFFAGRLIVRGNQPRKNMVIIGGCRAADEIKWAANKKLGPQVVDYGDYTANGNDNPLLHQAYGGAYYQKCYFQFITHSQYADNGEGKFNPSVYTEKYHFSRIRIVHPNDGVIGELDDLYAVHPKNIYQKDELDVTETTPLPEELGKGDGTNKIFHTSRTAVTGTLSVLVDCVVVPATDYSYDAETKRILFNTPPAADKEVLATYTYNQRYKYTLATTPRTPYRLDTATPFNPIGIAILKSNL